MKYESTRLKQMLAAEYVIGTLVGAARRRFQRLLAGDRWLRGEVRYWEQRFGELDAFQPVPPRDQVWAEIEHRMRAQQAKVVPLVVAPTARGLNFWRAWSGLATAASLVLALLLVTRQPEPAPAPVQRVLEVRVPAQVLVAALRLPKEDTQWTVSIQPDTRTLRVSSNGPAQLGANQDYQLWWLGDDGVTSLGLLPRGGHRQGALPADVLVKAEGKLAVSLEPAGGSKADNGGPSGPVLLAAPLVPSI
ncbi:MAG: anti-sigma factor [Panacagrimonas sp.]